MNKTEKRISKVKKVIYEIRGNRIWYRDTLAIRYQGEEAKIFKKGFNEGVTFMKRFGTLNKDDAK